MDFHPVVLRTPVTLSFGPANLSAVGDGFQTRGYNGLVPGPTIRTAPGERLSLVLRNSLEHDAVPLSDLPTNTFKAFNTTTLHTHGLHVSPRAPADDVFAMVAPGEESHYEYHIPVEHMGGTFWYHPHMHGASMMQVCAHLPAHHMHSCTSCTAHYMRAGWRRRARHAYHR